MGIGLVAIGKRGWDGGERERKNFSRQQWVKKLDQLLFVNQGMADNFTKSLLISGACICIEISHIAQDRKTVFPLGGKENWRKVRDWRKKSD